MLNEWLRRLRALVAEAQLQGIAETSNAPGNDASDATESDTQTKSDPGSSLVIPSSPPTPPSEEPDMRDVLVAKTKRALDEAVSLHLQALYGSEVGILIDWVVVAETVDPNLDDEVDKHALYVASSPDMTSWKLIGLASAFGRYVYKSTT